jgi:glycerol-3-phosphate dehydrogenase
VEDFLSRRTRHLLLDARSAIEAAPAIAGLMAKEMSKDENWIRNQVADFNFMAKNYLPALN